MDAFGHEVEDKHPDFVVLRLNHCPLVEPWKEIGVSPGEQETLCDIACQIDLGKFETAGYRIAFNWRIADACKSCDMRITL